MNSTRTAGAGGRPLALALLALLAAAAPAAAQVLPPIYKPLPVEQGDRIAAAADSLRAREAELRSRARVLEEGARTLRANGTGVAEKLAEQAARLAEQAAQLESRAGADRVTAQALAGQAEQFAQRAGQSERERQRLRAEIRRLLTPDSVAPDALGISTPVVDPAARERAQALAVEVRADSQAAAAFQGEAQALRERVAELGAAADAASARAAELRAQEAQLRGYAGELLSGRGASEPTAAHLEREAAQLSAAADGLERAARERSAQAEQLRVQAGRSWLPVRSRDDAMRFYGEDGRSSLRSIVLSLGEGGLPGSVNGEMVSDYAGPVRLGVGVVIARPRDAEQDSARAATERFYAGGGNLVLHASLPLLFHRSPYHSLTLQTLNKVALDAPAGRAAEADGVPANLDLGVEGYATFNTFASRIRAFGLLRSALAVGNEAFYRGLGMQSAAFPYAQATFGVEVASLAKVLLSGARSVEGPARELSLTVQLSPNRK